ncbi:type II general secretion pathway F protein [Pseudomonas sp. Os17]|nr:type II general secretion pathway F protein [Pseudomonas sp. Os17]
MAFQWNDQAYWGFLVLALGVGLFAFINTKKLYGTWMGPSSEPAQEQDQTAG